MSTTHTPGPWYADKIQDRTAYNIFMPGYGSAGASVQHCSNATGCMGPEVEYNARLIAAAPDMLAALQTAHMAVCNWIPTNAGSRLAKDRALAEIDAAIARATGA